MTGLLLFLLVVGGQAGTIVGTNPLFVGPQTDGTPNVLPVLDTTGVITTSGTFDIQFRYAGPTVPAIPSARSLFPLILRGTVPVSNNPYVVYRGPPVSSPSDSSGLLAKAVTVQAGDYIAFYGWGVHFTYAGGPTDSTVFQLPGLNPCNPNGVNGAIQGQNWNFLPCTVSPVPQKRRYAFQAELIPIGSMAADPHITGPMGHKFDFDGKPLASYIFLDSPRLSLVATMSENVVPTTKWKWEGAHFISSLNVTHLNTSFTLHASKPHELSLEQLNAYLSGTGAIVTSSNSNKQFALNFNLCPGVLLEISFHFNGMHYLNVELGVPGCHDDFSGPLGMLYRCHGLPSPKDFHWDHALEESFRVQVSKAF
jgi:hypothetical protein